MVPRAIDGDEFECTRCQGACVESPYEGFERWAGVWHVSYADGSENQLTIHEDGTASLLNPPEGQAAGEANNAQLVWAPLDHEGFQMRLQGHFGPGVVEYFGMDPSVDEGAEISIRHHGLHGNLVTGCAQRDDEESDGRGDEAVGMDVEEFEQALDRGFEAMMGWFAQGADQTQMQQQFRQLSAPLADIMRNNTALQDQLRTLTQQLRTGTLGAAPGGDAIQFGGAVPFGAGGQAGVPLLFD